MAHLDFLLEELKQLPFQTHYVKPFQQFFNCQNILFSIIVFSTERLTLFKLMPFEQNSICNFHKQLWLCKVQVKVYPQFVWAKLTILRKLKSETKKPSKIEVNCTVPSSSRMFSGNSIALIEIAFGLVAALPLNVWWPNCPFWWPNCPWMVSGNHAGTSKFKFMSYVEVFPIQYIITVPFLLLHVLLLVEVTILCLLPTPDVVRQEAGGPNWAMRKWPADFCRCHMTTNPEKYPQNLQTNFGN